MAIRKKAAVKRGASQATARKQAGAATKASPAKKTARQAPKKSAPTAARSKSAKARAGGAEGLPWTRRLRARVYGTHLPSPLDPPLLNAEQAWERLRKIRGKPQLFPMVKGDNVAFERELQVIRAELDSPVPPPLGDDRKERLRVAVFEHESELARGPAGQWSQQSFEIAEAFLAFWIARAGLAQATRLAFAPMPRPALRATGSQRRIILGDGQKRPEDLAYDDPPLIYHDPWWLQLRRAVFQSSPEAQAAARPEATGFLQTAIFSCDPSEAHAEVRRLLAQPAISYGGTCLLVALRDADLALRFARAQPLNYATATGLLAYTIVDNLGAAAEPVLRELPKHVMSGAKTRATLLEAAAFASS